MSDMIPGETPPSTVLEHAVLQIIPGQQDAFEQAFAKASPIIESMPGFRSIRFQRGIEHPNRYLLLVEWDSVEDHEEGFRKSREYQDWKKLLHHFYDPFPDVEHFSLE